ncbi:hypothetical protein Z045_03420 [Rhodococcus pyridinivorans KG-16]|uniref:Uncharacterized protein n=1 Tax=Rhodococcus pyridinivorans KG-16 TaxID=1441730 RepID=A0A0V9UR50_9NOCA|nr:hypothetical protein Z045_03420 [Rhodococcus pyridinivorans KG-16]
MVGDLLRIGSTDGRVCLLAPRSPSIVLSMIPALSGSAHSTDPETKIRVKIRAVPGCAGIVTTTG